MFIRLTSVSCQSMAHIAIYVNLHTILRAVRPSTCSVVLNDLGHLIRAPHHFQNPWMDRIHIWSDDRYGYKVSLFVPSPLHPWPEGQGRQGHGLGSL